MKSNSAWRTRLAQIVFGAAIVIALVVVRGTKAGNEPIHLTSDWSHRHLVFSAPHNLGQHVYLLSNPRYAQQLVRRNAEARRDDRSSWRWRRAPEPNVNPLHGDWSLNMGTGATVGAGNYPAKFSFDATSANCAEVNNNVGPQPAQPDFVVYNTSLPGSTQGTASATGTFTGFTQNSGQIGTVRITNGANSVTLTASLSLNTGLNFEVGAGAGSNAQEALNLRDAINRNNSTVGVTASTAGGAVVTVTANTPGTAGNSITLQEPTNTNQFQFSGGNSPAITNLAGGADVGQATIGAFTNLYVGTCTNATVDVPNSYWAYNTGTTGAVVTSPILSSDGKQVGFVQNMGATGTLVLLKWQEYNGNFTAQIDITDSPGGIATATTHTVSNANYRTCTVPCMTTLAFPAGGTTTDTNSSPFYDYANDVIYVGDDGGHLRRFNNVFNGTPSQQAVSGFPHTMISGGKLTSPIFDSGTGKVFVGSSTGRLSAVLASTGVETQGGQVDGTLGITDSPIIDTTNGMVYVASSNTQAGTANVSGIYAFPTGAGFTAGTTGTETVISPTNPGTKVYSGAFDQQWFLGNAGSMYVCAAASGSATPTLYQIDVSNLGVLGTVHTGPPLATGAALCSPITEFFNTSASTDLIFVSVTTLGKDTSPQFCPTAGAGCIMSWDVSNFSSGSPIIATTVAAAHATEAGGTSAVVVDGSSATAGASQVYFSPLANQPCPDSGDAGGCAIQATQSDLN